MISFFIAAIKIIILLGFLIFIHELGHFLIAKGCKVKINEFAIGFGPTIWEKQGKETKYAIRLIPLGGFVSMEGEDEKSEDSRSFSKASIPKRIAIVVAGATVNIIFAVVVYFVLISTSGTYVSNKVSETIDGYAAQEIGIQAGDEIIQINDKEIKSKKDLDDVLSDCNGEELNIKVERNEEFIEYNTKPTQVDVKSTGIYLDDNAKIIAVEKGSSSQRQGIQANDKLIKVNDVEINQDPNKAIEAINQDGLNTMVLTVERNHEEIQIELTPDYIPTYYLGIGLGKAPDTIWNRCVNGWMETTSFLSSIFDNLKQLFTGNVGVNQMMGPVGISEVVAKTDGFREFFQMMALISLSLGITNLLPIPALDGGKLIILIIEAIRRKPMKQETEINIQLIGFCILIAISLYVTYNDILRIF